MSSNKQNGQSGQNGQSEQEAINSFTLVHLIVGVVARLLNIPFLWWLIIHIIFEIWESSRFGISFFANAEGFFKEAMGITWETYQGDSAINSIFDTLAAMAGWWIADFVIRKIG